MSTKAEFIPKKIKLSPSGADRWSRCPGSAYLEVGLPYESSPWAVEGSAVHALAEWAIQRDKTLDPEMAGQIAYYADPKSGFIKYLSGRPYGLAPVARQDIPFSAKNIADADTYVAVVRNLAKQWGVEPQIELKIRWIDDLSNGRVDCVLFDAKNRRLAVIDYKNGRGVVPAEGNRQMAIYADAILADIIEGEEVETVYLAIVQPNGESGPPLKVWKAPISELNALTLELYHARERAIDMANGDTPLEFVPGDVQCQWCKAKALCPALKDQALAAIPDLDPDLETAEGAAVYAPPSAAVLDSEQISDILSRWPLVRTWVESLEAEATARLTKGEPVPGWKLVRSASRRQITDPDGLIAAAELNGWEVTEPKIKPLGLLDGCVPKAELAKYVSKPEGKITLVPETDKRPAIMAKAELMEGL